MSDTPRNDRQDKVVSQSNDGPIDYKQAYIDRRLFACQLERELAEAREVERKLVAELLEDFNNHEPHEALRTIRKHLGLVNRFKCDACGGTSNTTHAGPTGCDLCHNGHTHVIVVQELAAKAGR